MTDPIAQAGRMREAFDTIEEAYEFMLAYAAQGRKTDAEAGGESQIRQFLRRFSAALEALDREAAAGLGGAEGRAFVQMFQKDIAVMRSVISLLMTKPSISSDMVDNTNGLIAVRALLTDIFFTDQVLLPPR